MPDPVMPDPAVWPECSVCATTWILRRAISFKVGKFIWVWQRDCKHKADPVLMNAEGPVPEPGQ